MTRGRGRGWLAGWRLRRFPRAVRAGELAERDVFRLGGPGSAELAVVSMAVLAGELVNVHLHVVVVGGEAAEELALAGEREFNVDALRTVWLVG